jgi:parallel beta-helix repeat protein
MGVRYRGNLSDNTFESNNDKGIYVIHHSYLNITGNSVNDTRIHVACGSCGSPTTGYGLHAVDSTVRVENSIFSWNDEAVYVVNSVGLITGNTVFSCGNGIHLSGSAVTVSGNDIHTNIVGIQDTLSTSDINNNTVHDNQDGIYVLNPNGTSVRDNTVEDNLYGITVRNGIAAVLNNTVSGSRQAGLAVERPTELRVSGNSFLDNLNDTEVTGKEGYATSVSMDNNTFGGTSGWNLFGSSIPADRMPALTDNTYENQDGALGRSLYQYQLTIKVTNATVGTNITVEGDDGFFWRESVEWGLKTATRNLFAPWKIEDPQGNVIYPELTVTVDKKGETLDETLQLDEDRTLEFEF